jgi:hypothetical protein
LRAGQSLCPVALGVPTMGLIGLTIYDPDLDPDARCARLLADLVEHALAT